MRSSPQASLKFDVDERRWSGPRLRRSRVRGFRWFGERSCIPPERRRSSRGTESRGRRSARGRLGPLRRSSRGLRGAASPSPRSRRENGPYPVEPRAPAARRYSRPTRNGCVRPGVPTRRLAFLTVRRIWADCDGSKPTSWTTERGRYSEPKLTMARSGSRSSVHCPPSDVNRNRQYQPCKEAARKYGPNR